ncbi:MAG TPA: efflux RND transporter permease subunit [Gemmatimonadaceae bacterium]|jgi:HAE1 family hydrophobic/amphiphilic exporter-1|nr:efflux RND transporter permease subunit [Gemmatimonadaceae bacterium]
MIISDFAIKRPLITVVAMVAMVIFGLFALFKLKTDEFPDVAPPFLTVGIIYPGASPEIVESEILKPVEEQIGAISGVKRMMGKAYDGYAMLMIEFYFDKDLNVASQETRDAISTIRSDLPTEMKEPIVQKFNNTDRPIVSVAISSTVLSPPELTRLADPGITRELRAIQGVADVQIFGKVERELTVEVDPHKLQAANISVAQVVQALEMQNLAAPVGRVNGALDERAIRLRGRLENPAEFDNLVVADRNGQLIRLNQVATIKDGTEEPRTLALYNGKEAIGIDIKKAKGYSTTDVASRIRARLDQIKPTLPKGTNIELVKDSGTRVEHAVSNVEEALFLGAVLTVLVVFLFLNSWRSTVITGVALPISVLASFIAVWALGFKLETMSLLGLSLAIGILIDDAIVVRENIVRHVEMGKDHFTAAHDGTDEIGLAVAATTFSILAVFVPIGFMPGIGGQWFKPFALTIACSVAVSLFVSFSLDPMLSAYWADPHKLPHERGWITRQLDKFNDWFNKQAQNYKKVIAWALDHRAAMVTMATLTFFASFVLPSRGISGLAAAIVGIAIMVFAFTKVGLHWSLRTLTALIGFAAFVALPRVVPPVRTVGTAFFPEDDRAEFTMQLETPPGSNLEYTRLKAEEAARVARTHPEVEYTYTTLGNNATGGVDEGAIYVRTVPKNKRSKSVEQLAEELRGETKNVVGATISVFTNDLNGGFKAIQLQLRGQDVVALAQAADMVKAEVQKIPGAVDIGLSTKGQKPELELDLNRGAAGSLGLTVGQVAQSLRPAFAGIDAGYWIDPTGKSRKVTVRLTPESRTRAADLMNLPMTVIGPNGAPSTLPLGQVSSIKEGLGPAIIDHLNREPVVTVELNTAGRAAGDVTADIQSRLDKMRLPAGVRYTIGGDAESQAEVFGQIFSALGLAVLLMYLILVVQFGSFIDPVAILMSLPLSLIGVMVALAVTKMTINIMSLIGVILLMGIVAKNAILLIDFAKWAREERGVPLREALIEAGAIRLRPILMTTFALIAGMIPVALGRGEGAQFRAPLGVAVIGGVITSTFLTLLVIPTGYEILDEWRHAFMRWMGATPKQMTAEHAVPSAGD